MSDITINNAKINKTITVPPSKSAAHRGIICAALTRGVCTVYPVSLSDDIKATISCITALGCKTEYADGVLKIDARQMFGTNNAQLFCGESGSTLRFMMPVAALSGKTNTFFTCGRLAQRPINDLLIQLAGHGVSFSKAADDAMFPLNISGSLCGGEYTIPGDISSQYITGLLLALPLCNSDSVIRLTSPLQSVGYIALTLQIMAKFGVHIDILPDGWRIKGNQRYAADSFVVEGDWSQSAFFMTAAALGSDIVLKGLDIDSVQGDRAAIDIYRGFGVDIRSEQGDIILKQGHLIAQDIDASQIPDLVPAIAVTAALAKGTSRIYNAGRLRLKESDRLKSTCNMINSLGGKCNIKDDSLIIEGAERLHGGRVDGCNDHRIIMAAAVAAAGCENSVTISGYEAVAKSYPDFFEVIGQKPGA